MPYARVRADACACDDGETLTQSGALSTRASLSGCMCMRIAASVSVLLGAEHNVCLQPAYCTHTRSSDGQNATPVCVYVCVCVPCS